MGRSLPRLLLLVAGLLAWALPSAAAAPAPADGFAWPLRGVPVVERPFDPPRTTYGAGHRGVDLHAGPGERVLAAGSGQVTYAGLLAGRGVVAVTHPGGLRTTYEPVLASVRVGQQVSRGAVLGTVATGHDACRATCLHWGLRRGETYLDPLSLVEAAPVRLLPLQQAPARPPAAGGAARVAPRTTAAPGLTAPSAPQPAPSSPPLAQAALAAGSLLTGVLLLRSRRVRAPGRLDPVPSGPSTTPVSAAVVDLGVERDRRRPA